MSSINNVYPKPFDIGQVGGGVRYAPSKKLLLDMAYMTNSTTPRAGRDEYTVWGDSSSFSYGIDVSAFRGLLSYSFDIGHGFFAYSGAGVTYYKIGGGLKAGYLTPTVQIRGEYFLQERVGVSLAATADILNKVATSRGDSAYYPFRRDMAKLGKLYVESSVSVYF